MGRSRGGLTTKIHALVDAEGRPIRLKLTEGQAHDGASARDMLGGIEAGQTLLADRAYDANWLRDQMAEQGAWANVRAVATRYDKRDDNFLATVQLASIRIWLRTYESVA